jgi:hypothetical protein
MKSVKVRIVEEVLPFSPSKIYVAVNEEVVEHVKHKIRGDDVRRNRKSIKKNAEHG